MGSGRGQWEARDSDPVLSLLATHELVLVCVALCVLDGEVQCKSSRSCRSSGHPFDAGQQGKKRASNNNREEEGEKAAAEFSFPALFTEAYLLFQMETRPFFLLLFLLVLRVSLSRLPFLNHSIRGKGFPVTLHLSRSRPFDLTLKSAFLESRRKFLIPNFPLFAASS